MRARKTVRIGLALSAVALVLPRFAAGVTCGAGCVLVNTAADTVNASCGEASVGTCSLRDAVSKPFGNIKFAIGTGAQTITLLTDLPDLLVPYTIDATTQPGYAGVPLIQIHQGGTATHGFRTRGPATNTLTLSGFDIRGFNGGCLACAGVILSDPADLVRPGGHTIRGCYFGRMEKTDPASDGNTYGILDNTLGSNTFGGTTAADRNVISGNSTGIAIGLQGAGYSTRSVIQGNYFGTNPAGTDAVSNVYGVWTGKPYSGFTPGILVGGGAPGAGNLFVSTSGNGVEFDQGTNDVVEGNAFGLDVTGMISLGIDEGIRLNGETNASVLNNVIAINPNGGSAGIYLSSYGVSFVPTTGAVVQGNYIGTDVTGDHVLQGGGQGIWIDNNARNNLIGGTAAGQGNVIGGFHDGIFVSGDGGGSPGSINNVIQGNRIGIGVHGSPIPNTANGINVSSPEGMTVIGGENPGEGNIIADNGQVFPFSYAPGISIQNGSGNRISGNSIYGNTGLGIDLGRDGVTPNDPCDADTGPNNRQNFPVLTAVTPGSSTRIQGTLNSAANTTYRLEFFANTACDPSGFGPGRAFIGFLDVTTDGNCNASFDVTYPFATNPGEPIAATATDPAGSTSEFSACLPTGRFFTVAPCRVADTRNPPGPSGGPALAANTVRAFPVAGLCAIPSTATAVAINLAIVQPSDGGDLRVFPTGGVAPLASALNFRSGIVRANNAIVALGTGGQISVQCDMAAPAGSTQFLFDVFGYFQ
jgi:CSLREA domain-containing protein